jgi:hypothetical protein
MGLVARAVEDLKAAVLLDPASTTGYNSLGLALCEQGNHEEALAAMNKAVETAPKNAILQSNRGMVYFQLGNSVEAIKVCTVLRPTGRVSVHVRLLSRDPCACACTLQWWCLLGPLPPFLPPCLASLADV